MVNSSRFEELREEGGRHVTLQKLSGHDHGPESSLGRWMWQIVVLELEL